MSNSDQVYESHILKSAINKYLDQKLTNTQEDLKRIELNKDELVWDIVTTIHNQSGYKVSISFAKDIIEQRIANIKEQIKEAEEKARLEMMRIEAEKVEKQTKIINFLKNLPPELNFDETKLDIFIKVSKICCEHHLCDEFNELDSDEIFNQKLFIKILETTIFTVKYYTGGGWFSSNPLKEVSASQWNVRDIGSYKKFLATYSGDSLDATELIMALEEELDIEINDSEGGTLGTVRDIVEIIYTEIVSQLK